MSFQTNGECPPNGGPGTAERPMCGAYHWSGRFDKPRLAHGPDTHFQGSTVRRNRLRPWPPPRWLEDPDGIDRRPSFAPPDEPLFLERSPPDHTVAPGFVRGIRAEPGSIENRWLDDLDEVFEGIPPDHEFSC